MNSSHGTPRTEIKNPVFETEKDIGFIQHGEQLMPYDPDFAELRMNVLLLSYNRPRMLREAIDSVVMQDYKNLCLWILDDGSDFDIEDILNEYKDSPIDIVGMQQSRLMPEDRASRSRVAENINSALHQIPGRELVTYLCDDDIMAPRWALSASLALAANWDTYHIANGEVYWFKDGDDWRTQSQYGLPGFERTNRTWWATGSIVHRSDCYWNEGVKWYDNDYGHSQDVWFMNDLFNRHPYHLILGVPAHYHREHDGMLSSKLGRKDISGKYIPGFSPGKLESYMISGDMEL